MIRTSPRANNRKFCNTACRNAYPPNLERIRAHKRAFNERRGAPTQPHPDKNQCAICGKWYKLVTYHVAQKHKMLARDYKKMQGLDIKHTLAPQWWIEEKRAQALAHPEMIQHNLITKGKRHRFKKGDKSIGRYERSAESIARLKLQFKH